MQPDLGMRRHRLRWTRGRGAGPLALVPETLAFFAIGSIAPFVIVRLKPKAGTPVCPGVIPSMTSGTPRGATLRPVREGRFVAAIRKKRLFSFFRFTENENKQDQGPHFGKFPQQAGAGAVPPYSWTVPDLLCNRVKFGIIPDQHES